MSTKVAINGFGRIGRLVLRAGLDQGIDVVAVNDIAPPEKMAHLFKYDSVHGIYQQTVSLDGDVLTVGDQKINVLSEKDPADLPWDELDVDVVIESTGVFREREDAARHLKAGADKVIISAPGKNSDATIVIGVNDDEYDAEKHDIVSNASCTTNCLAPMVKILNDEFGLESGIITTTHAYTATQNILDGPAGKDYRRMRAAAVSIIPTSTGAATATTEVLPELKGKLDGMAMRVPVPDGSITDLSAVLARDVTREEVNAAFKKAADGEMKGILQYTEEELVSTDYVGNPHSSIIDAEKTTVVNGNHVKVLGWYDNEWGYSNRLIDLAGIMVSG
ncbi:MAG: type I glyceraldehyde-3-phosphate dehydrogenase [bacterium]